MDAWQELVRQALVGNVSSKKLSPILLERFKSFGLQISKEQNPEIILLKAAAIHSKLYASAQLPALAPSNLPAPAPEEELPYCNAARKQQLLYILRHNYDEILEEFLQLLAFNKVILPPDLLPQLLAYGAKHPFIQEALIPCIGKRGLWLAQFCEAWHYALEIDHLSEDLFYYGNREERLYYIQYLRENNSDLVLDLLEEVWESEGFMMRVDFIHLLEAQLSMKDEPFLEKALADSRKEVREAAAALLALLPHSRLVQRMQELSEQLVQYDSKKDTFEVTLPISCNTHMKRDGIQPRKIFIKDHGPKANQLAQIIAKIPPNWWCQKHYNNPQQLLHLAAKTEWRNVFVWAWAMAAKNYNDQEWIMACHRFYLDTFFKHNWSNFNLDFLYQDLPNDLFNLLATEYLNADNKKTLSDDHPIVTFLLAEGQKWEDKMALQVIHRIKQTIHHDTYVFHWSLKAVLKRAAFSISPQLYEQVSLDWPMQSQAWHSWQKEVDSLLNILKFRLEIEELKD